MTDAALSPPTTANDDTTTNTNANTNMDQNTQSPRLRRNLGLIPAVSYVAGGIIGVGIFVSPQTVLLNTGRSVGIAMCVWVFCAFLAFCGALTYAELGTRIRKSGGSYTYVTEAWGRGAGFVFLWTQLLVVRPLSCSIGAMAAAEYALRPAFLDCPQLIPPAAKHMLALCAIGLLVFLNGYSTSWAAAIQTASTMCKLAALVVIIVTGLVFLSAKGGSDNFQDLFVPEDMTAGGVTLAIYSCTYAYTGWDNLNVATEEVKNPQRNLPLATLLGIALPAVVYLLAIVSYHAALTTPQIVSGVAVAAMFSKETVPQLLWVIVPCIAVSASGIVNVIVFTTSRISFIGGRDELFPQLLSMVSVSGRTPIISCLYLGVTASVAALLGDITSVLGAYSFFRAFGETAAILGLFKLRRKFPASADTYVVPTVMPVVYLVFNLSLAVAAITLETSRYVVPLLLVLSGIPLYFLSSSALFTAGPLRNFYDMLVGVSRNLLLCEFASKTY